MGFKEQMQEILVKQSINLQDNILDLLSDQAKFDKCFEEAFLEICFTQTTLNSTTQEPHTH
jgi:hypothetical protein